MPKRKSNKKEKYLNEQWEKYKTIRKHVTFKVKKGKISATDNRLINKYYKAYNTLTIGRKEGYQEYTTKSEARLKTAKKAAQNPNLKHFKTVFFRKPAGEKLTIKFKGKVLTTETRHVKTGFVSLNKNKLAIDPIKEINNKLAPLKSDKKKQIYFVQAGEHEIQTGYSSIGGLAAYVSRLVGRYETGGTHIRSDESNHYRKWLSGVNIVQLKGQATKGEYLKRKRKARKKKK